MSLDAGRYAALCATFALSMFIEGTSIVCAQSIVPTADGIGTLVNINGNIHNISGGTLSTDGQNLFHSFESFGLTQQETANFLANPELQNILGRVTGGGASQIDGLLQVSGGAANLYLMNPAGIVFGPNAQLNIPGSFAAATANGIAFESGQFNSIGDINSQTLVGSPQGFLFAPGSSGSIINTGNLAVEANHNLTLVGSTVINTGTLTAPGGTISVVAIPESEQVRIVQDGAVLGLAMNADQLAQSPIDRPIAASLPELITGGTVDIASDIQVDDQNRVWLTGSQVAIPSEPGTTIASGNLDASDGTRPGGTVQVLGKQVALLNGVVDVSGSSGGNVFIGGEFQGGGELPTAQNTVIGESSVVRADAFTNGDGGQVTIWADGNTQFAGEISAQGGSGSGDGGFVEVSGLQNLNFLGNVVTDAANGASGTLLLDPTDITIVAGDSLDSFDGDVLFSDIGPTVIAESQLERLSGDTNIVIQATNSITIEPVNRNFTFQDNPIIPGIPPVAIPTSQAPSLDFQPGDGGISFEAGGTFMSKGRINTFGRDISILAASITFETGEIPNTLTTFASGITGGGDNLDISTRLNGDAGSISLTSTNGDISFVDIATRGGLTQPPGSVEININSGSLNFDVIDTRHNLGVIVHIPRVMEFCGVLRRQCNRAVFCETSKDGDMANSGWSEYG